MPQSFIEFGRDQDLLLPPSMREWLPDDRLAWVVAGAVQEIDLGAFYGAYREDGWGRAGFKPQVMVALPLQPTQSKATSSRQRRRVLAANQIPDHTMIARFRARHEQPLADTFIGVPALCAKAGLVAAGVVALDGGLISANTSPATTRAYPEIRAEVEWMLEDAAASAECENARAGRGPARRAAEGLADRRERLRRCREELEADHAAEMAAHEEHLKRRAAWQAEHGPKLAGRNRPHPPKTHCRRPRSTPPIPTPGLCNTASRRSKATTPRRWPPSGR